MQCRARHGVPCPVSRVPCPVSRVPGVFREACRAGASCAGRSVSPEYPEDASCPHVVSCNILRILTAMLFLSLFLLRCGRKSSLKFPACSLRMNPRKSWPRLPVPCGVLRNSCSAGISSMPIIPLSLVHIAGQKLRTGGTIPGRALCLPMPISAGCWFFIAVLAELPSGKNTFAITLPLSILRPEIEDRHCLAACLHLTVLALLFFPGVLHLPVPMQSAAFLCAHTARPVTFFVGVVSPFTAAPHFSCLSSGVRFPLPGPGTPLRPWI